MWYITKRTATLPGCIEEIENACVAISMTKVTQSVVRHKDKCLEADGFHLELL